MKPKTNTQLDRQARSRHNERTARKPLSIYFAGDLWNHKDLIGNALLADYIDKRSCGRYRCVVPQNLEQADVRAVNIRNQDLKQVMDCDVCLFNFDGHELDSGTVVEYMYAKMLDIPCVIVRTDFRAAGDGNKADNNPWNLMVSNWPRTKVLKLHAMAEYQAALKALGSLTKATRALYAKYADLIIEQLDAVVREEPILLTHGRQSLVYRWALVCAGSGLTDKVTHRQLEELVAHKQAKGLL